MEKLSESELARIKMINRMRKHSTAWLIAHILKIPKIQANFVNPLIGGIGIQTKETRPIGVVTQPSHVVP
jgi:hypothetical protein